MATPTTQEGSLEEATSKTPKVPGAVSAVILLTAMNLLNYVDRYVPSAVKDLFKKDLGLTDAETAYPLTAFILVYMIASPIFGGLADKFSRKKLIALGVALWSLATAAAALSTDFWTFLFARSLVGVGEAAYATIAPSLIADFFAPAHRNRVLTFFYVAIPVGSALGFTLGGIIGDAMGWRASFLICGLPGVLVALLALLIKEPPRGHLDPPVEGESTTPPAWPAALKALAKNPTYVFTVAGYTAVTFATGGMADWFPTYLSRFRGMSLAEAGSAIGTVTVIGGLGGTIVGGLLGDVLKKHTKNGYLALSGLSMVPATVLAALALVVQDATTTVVLVGAAQFFLWFYNGPVNALIVNSTSALMRARAFAVSIFCIHALGDAISPPIIGIVSDASSLPTAVVIVPIALGVGSLVWIVGWRMVPPLEDNAT